MMLGLSVSDPTGCVSEGETRRQLQAHLPTDIDDVTVEIQLQSASGDARHLLLTVNAGQAPWSRPLELSVSECAVAPQVIARVVQRHLQRIQADAVAEGPDDAGVVSQGPADDDTRDVVSTPEPAGADALAADDDVVTGAHGDWPLTFSTTLAAGVGVVAVPVTGTGVVAVRAGVGLGDLTLSLSADGSATPPLHVGAGAAVLTRLRAKGEAGWKVPLGFAQLQPRVHAFAGTAIAWGQQFAQSQAAVLPTVGLGASVQLMLPFGISVEAVGDVPLIGLRLVGGSDVVDVYDAQVAVLLGFSHQWGGG